jgi:hypothetical protein
MTRPRDRHLSPAHAIKSLSSPLFFAYAVGLVLMVIAGIVRMAGEPPRPLWRIAPIRRV